MTDTAFPTDHLTPAATLQAPPPLTAVPVAPVRGAAEEARTLVQNGVVAGLSTLSDGGHPWGSMVTYGVLAGGVPAILVSTLAEHGRNLVGDRRASLLICEAAAAGRDPLDAGRVTLAGVMEEPATDAERELARAAVRAASPASSLYGGFGDFTLWVLRVQRVRWVGGYGRMDSATPEAYAAAQPDPVAPSAAYAVAHLNDDHAAALLDMAHGLAGYPDATAATCTRADRLGLDLTLTTPRGTAYTRVGFAQPCTTPDGLRAATVELARRARAA